VDTVLKFVAADVRRRTGPQIRLVTSAATLLAHACDAETLLLEQLPDFVDVITLKFDAAFFGGAAATAGIAQFFGERLDLLEADIRRKLIDNHHGFPAAMRRLATQNHSTQFYSGRKNRVGFHCAGSVGRFRFLGFAEGQAVDFKIRKRVVKLDRPFFETELDSILSGHIYSKIRNPKSEIRNPRNSGIAE
jgi:hypothetical protein